MRAHRHRRDEHARAKSVTPVTCCRCLSEPLSESRARLAWSARAQWRARRASTPGSCRAGGVGAAKRSALYPCLGVATSRANLAKSRAGPALTIASCALTTTTRLLSRELRSRRFSLLCFDNLCCAISFHVV
jgi:hypothetical protein